MMHHRVTVHTFGFGTSYNAEFLEKISESGRGMYVLQLLEFGNKGMIPESFAKCLDGLAMIVSKTLKLKISALLLKFCSQGYKSEKSEISENSLECKIKIDIQFTEACDLVFESSITKVYFEKHYSPVAQLSCKYENVIKKYMKYYPKLCN